MPTAERSLQLSQQMARPQSELSILARTTSMRPTVPDRIELGETAHDAAAEWNISVQLSWCNDIECRFDLFVSSNERSQHLEGWIASSGEQTLSDLEEVAVCLTASDGERTLTININANNEG